MLSNGQSGWGLNTYGLRTFRLLGELYAHVADLHEIRRRTAWQFLAWISDRAAPTSAAPGLAPHTPEWFAALDAQDPRWAGAVRRVVQLAGKPDVCSVCGDEPAPAYRFQGAEPAAGAVDTLRLCPDCLGIRGAMGETFVPMP